MVGTPLDAELSFQCPVSDTNDFRGNQGSEAAVLAWVVVPFVIVLAAAGVLWSLR
jgi:hypothetical protein